MRNGQFKLLKNDKTTFGGSFLKGNAREKRPFSPRCATHSVLRSSHAKGEFSLLRASNQKVVRKIVYDTAKTFFVRIDRFINVGNHLHLLIKAPNSELQANFFRTISALIARHITGARKGKPSRLKKFWDNKPFTRLVAWKAYQSILYYLSLNSLEAIGFTKQTAKEYLRTLERIDTFSTA